VAQQVLAGRYEWFEDDVLDPAGDGPMIPAHTEPAARQFQESPAVAAPTVPASATREEAVASGGTG
jgi:hypothetical protein